MQKRRERIEQWRAERKKQRDCSIDSVAAIQKMVS